MTTPDLIHVEAAISSAEDARALDAKDPRRHKALEDAKQRLTDVWTPDHTAYVKAGPQIGRVSSDDPVRVLAQARRNELKRLRAASNRTSGTPRPRVRRPDRRSMQGTVGYMHQILNGIAGEHEAIKTVLGSGEVRARRGGAGRYRSMARLNEEAKQLLENLAESRADLNLKWQRYSTRPHVLSLDERDAIDAMRHRVELLRENCDILAAELRASAKARVPIARPRRRDPWTLEEVVKQVVHFRRFEGRMPTAREMNEHPQLPCYTTVYRLLGERPSTKLDRLVAQATT